MADPITLTGLLMGAAAACGTAVVEEITKDAYGALKEKVVQVFGARAGRALAKIENDATRAEGERELGASIGSELSPEDAEALQPAIARLLEALRQDQTARTAVQSRIDLDLDVGGDAQLRNIEGADQISVKATTKGNFIFDSVKMATREPPGK
ncbi:MAG: hypothetical protein DI537_37235 [Stutzerimonas stutzeri]|nr:MAG: hypothetical protein DI537_37235 [Stutzerimonas stutzeri]